MNSGSKSLTRLALYSTSTHALDSEAMSRAALSDPSLNGSKKKTSDEKKCTPKTLRDSKRHLIKKEAPLKTLRGQKRHSMKKETPLKMLRTQKRPLMKKETPLNMLKGSKKTSNEKRGIAKMKGTQKTFDEK
jgi:hypothetical protein